MKSGFFKIAAVMIMTAATALSSLSQPKHNSGELKYSSDQVVFSDPVQLEAMHKMAMEADDEGKARAIEEKLNSLNPESEIVKGRQTQDELTFIKELPAGVSPEYLFSNPKVYQGSLLAQNGYHRIIDIKTGDDNNLYAAVIWKNSEKPSGIGTFRSTNNGLNWSYLYGFYYSLNYIGNISLLVESKNNQIADSTRLIIFFNRSSNSNMDNASLLYASWRVNGTGVQISAIADASPGNEIAHLSAVSDGAFYQGATYFGVVFTETNASMTTGQSVKYIRTMNWGSTWSQVTLLTGTNDFRVTADLKRSSPDSVMIAVERRSDVPNYQIKVIATPFTPTAASRTINISAGNYQHTNPCITIRQTNPSSSILLTAIRNGVLVSYYSTDNGITWSQPIGFSTTSANRVAYAHCSSNPNGTKPFAVAWVSMFGDSVNISNSELSFIVSSTKNNINRTIVAYSGCSPVSAVTYREGENFGAVGYTGVSSSTPADVYFNGKGMITVAARFIPEGLYKSGQDILNCSDTVTAILRKPVSPYEPVDTAKAVIDQLSYTAIFKFTKSIPSSLYLVLKHRNTIETWGSGSHLINVNWMDSAYINFSTYQGTAYGFNQKSLAATPSRFGFFTGDVNQDGTIDASDLSQIDNNSINFASGYLVTDLTGDNFTDATDYSLADNNASSYASMVRP